MASKKKDDGQDARPTVGIGAVEGPNENVGAPLAAPEDRPAETPGATGTHGRTPGLPTGAAAGDYFIPVNTTRSPMQCALSDGTHVNLGPRCAGRTIHIGKPVLKRLRTHMMFAWAKLGWLQFRECAGGE